MRYFLKRCGFQELGSIGEDGKPKRGRYLMSSLNSEVLAMFPPLSIAIPNDTALLPIIPLYTQQKTYCNYVYHNSKFTGSDAKNPRNEYRIYLNNALEGGKPYIDSEDIIIIRKKQNGSPVSHEQSESLYYLDVVKDHFSGEYTRLSKLIESYPIRGGYGLYDGIIESFEEKVAALESGHAVKDILIDKSVTDRIRKSDENSKQHIFNTATFRDFVLAGYGNACAVTGRKSLSVLGDDLDVVYIKPRQQGGDCMPNNGIALSKSLSLPFVKGEFTLSKDYEIQVHPACRNQDLIPLNLQQIHVPGNSFFRPAQENIAYHREFIYGSFFNEIHEGKGAL